MKKYYCLALLMVGLSSSAQGIRFVNDEYLTVQAYVDPVASFKEHGLDFGAEVQLVSHKVYVKAGVENFSVLAGGYTAITGGVGLNLTSGFLYRPRYYGGIRLGVNVRDKTVYPLFGLEGGIDFPITKVLYVGVRGTGDWREDFRFWGGDPEMRWSGFAVVGFNLGKPWEGIQRIIVRNAYKKVY